MKQADSSIIIVRNVCVLTSASMIVKSFGPMIADHDLVKKSFGPMIADRDLVKKR
jgi:hypothetical protein